MSSARISPTAHYTSSVWFHHGMSHPALTTRFGRVLHALLRPMNGGYERLATHASLDMMLLARHHALDHLLERAIVSGEITQVVEVGAGMSPRGFRFAGRHPQLTYVESDLAAMAERKRMVLAQAGLLGARHRVVALDALLDESVAEIADTLDPTQGTAIVTEGLLQYFDGEAICGMWRRFARALERFPHGVYLSDLAVMDDVAHMRGAGVWKAIIATVARGRLHVPFSSTDDARGALAGCGFRQIAMHTPRELPIEFPGQGRPSVVRLIEARR